MFFSTWETYHTHTLYLGYFNGPTEGLIIATLIMAAAGYYGPAIYSGSLSDVFGHREIFGEATFLDLWVVVILITFSIAHLPACVYNVIRARQRKGLPVMPVFLEWTPIIISSVSATAWVYSPHSHLLTKNHLVLFAVTLSFVFGRMTTKIILAHLTRQPFPFWTMLLTPLVGGAILGNLPRFGLPMVTEGFELCYLWGYLIFAFVAYMHWAFFVIDRITAFLGIGCLTIRSEAPAAHPHVYQQIREGASDSVEEEIDLESGRIKHH